MTKDTQVPVYLNDLHVVLINNHTYLSELTGNTDNSYSRNTSKGDKNKDKITLIVYIHINISIYIYTHNYTVSVQRVRKGDSSTVRSRVIMSPILHPSLMSSGVTTEGHKTNKIMSVTI